MVDAKIDLLNQLVSQINLLTTCFANFEFLLAHTSMPSLQDCSHHINLKFTKLEECLQIDLLDSMTDPEILGASLAKDRDEGNLASYYADEIRVRI